MDVQYGGNVVVTGAVGGAWSDSGSASGNVAYGQVDTWSQSSTSSAMDVTKPARRSRRGSISDIDRSFRTQGNANPQAAVAVQKLIRERSDTLMAHELDPDAPPPTCSLWFLTVRFLLTLENLTSGGVLACAEVAVSKFFPGGFGWQLGAVVTVYAGFSTHSWLQYMLTGLGDCTGVFVGHCLYKLLTKKVFNKDFDMVAQVEVGIILAASSLVSGFVWTPALILAEWLDPTSLWPSLLIVGAVCGLCFFLALQAARHYLPRALGMKVYHTLPSATYLDDALLGVGVFGSSALFVSTSTSFDNDIFQSFLGIKDDVGVYGMVRAGWSTAIGFSVIVALQNLLLPAGVHWLDSKPTPKTQHSHLEKLLQGVTAFQQTP